MQASGVEAAPASVHRTPALSDTRGKHRISEEVKRLEQEARFLQEELEELKKMEKVSAALQEFLVQVESRPDPLLTETTGPTNTSWDCWFEGPQDLQGFRCWIF